MFHFDTYKKKKYFLFFKNFFFIDYHTLQVSRLVLMFCVEDHNGNKSWTLLGFYPQLYWMSFHACKAFV